MNKYIRETMLGSWHMIPSEPVKPRPRVERGPVVWVEAPDTRSTDYAHPSAPSMVVLGVDMAKPNSEVTAWATIVVKPAIAAAPSFQVGDVVQIVAVEAGQDRSHVKSVTRITASSWINGCFHVENDVFIWNCRELRLLGRPDASGWIPHKPGDPCPVPEGTKVYVKLRGPISDGGMACAEWNWGRIPHFECSEITAWRLAE